MKQKNSLYPYPVLGTGRPDYINSSFTSKINTRIEFNCFVVDVKFDLDDSVLLNLIANGSAAYFIRVECSETAYREKFYTPNDSYNINIELKDIQSKVEIYTYVVAIKDITDYQNPNFNPLYQGAKINIEKANILADGGGKEIQLNDNNLGYNDSESLFKVQRVIDNSAWIDVNFSHNDYVLICMSNELYSQYLLLSRSRFKNYIRSLIMLPVLVALLNSMAKDTSEHEDKKWFNTIREKLQSNDVSLEDLLCQNGKKSALVVAQKIFMNPIKKAMDEISAISDT